MSERKRKAQAVTELTIFGAILIFVIGSILRNAVDSGLNQNQSLKAMRYAMLLSLQGVRNVNKSRDTASIIFIEDRLSPDASKTGSLERMPLLQTGSGTFSNTILMPIDWGEDHNIPVTDLIVNGVHFTLSGARFIVYTIGINPSNPSQVSITDTTNGIVTNIPRAGNWNDAIGCPIFYSVRPSNHSEFCPGACADGTIDMNQRFDLNRNNDYTDDVPAANRANMAWQWKAVLGLVGNLDIDEKKGRYPSWDIDGDRKEETIYRAFAVPGTNIVQTLYVLDYQKGDLDGSFDDLDLINAGLGFQDRGLQKSVSVYTQVNDGTYLEINEGRLYVPDYAPGQEFVRSTNKKNTIDVISRRFKLDNDTGRFCNPVTLARLPTIGNIPGGVPNPVQYCLDTRLPGPSCFTTVTAGTNCYDVGTKNLFIRSRNLDRSGRKWVTQTR